MRSMPGRVPWPTPLPSVDQMMAEHRAEEERILERVRQDQIIRQAGIGAENRKEEEVLRLLRHFDDEAIKAMLNDMTPGEQAEWRAAMKAIAEGLRNGRLGLHNLGEFINSGAWRNKGD